MPFKKQRRAQKNQPRGTPENSATADADGVELDNGTIHNQPTKLTETDIPDDTEAATKSSESLANIAAEAGELLNTPSNENKPDSADLERVNNTAIEPDGRDTAHIHDSIHAGQATLDSKVPAIKSDIEDTSYSADIIDLTSDDGQYELEDQLQKHEINSVASRSTPGDHNPSTTEQRRKRRLSDMSKNDNQSGESAGKFDISH
jgi:hypothetical protein